MSVVCMRGDEEGQLKQPLLYGKAIGLCVKDIIN